MPKKQPIVTAVYIVLNEADYIWQSLESIYSAATHIVIVEGATKFAVKDHISPFGLSIDGTPQLIQAFMDTVDTKNKIRWIRAGWVETKTELRNRALEHVPSDTEFLLKIDGDELYLPEELKKAVAHMSNTGAFLGQAKHLMFWGSTHRVLTPPGEANHWWVDVLYKYHPKMFYSGHMLPMIDPATSFQDDPEKVVCLDDLYLYHFGWTRDKRKIVVKRWERLRQLQVEGAHVPHYQYLQNKDDYGLYMEAISHCKAFNLANIDGQHESIMPFEGPWPGQIVRHPFWRQPPEFFGVD
jgi:glycosyltransferase involved in cell wall biosynthesis